MRKMVDRYTAIGIGEAAEEKVLITLNESGADAWSYEDALRALCAIYGEEHKDAIQRDFDRFLEKIREAGILEE